ncbi:cytochrome C oxidase subunit II [Neisseria meningitidis]|nr:cytochrome C oxidase subunit II [Neisseria meningitidis]
MFWYVIGFCSFVVALLSLWVNVGAFGMQEDDTPQSDYEKRLGLGAKLKNKKYAGYGRKAAIKI